MGNYSLDELIILIIKAISSSSLLIKNLISFSRYIRTYLKHFNFLKKN